MADSKPVTWIKISLHVPFLTRPKFSPYKKIVKTSHSEIDYVTMFITIIETGSDQLLLKLKIFDFFIYKKLF
jgi:hypothetical protein